MIGDDEFDEPVEGTPPQLRELAELTRQSLIPKKSKVRYDQAYLKFKEWQITNRVEGRFTENVILAYLKELVDKLKYKPNTVWSNFSMLASEVNLHHKVDLHKYTDVAAFLKRNGKGYEPKKAEVFENKQVSTFLRDAPDHEYLAVKVVAVFGVLGACRTIELVKLTVDDVILHKNDTYLVKITPSASKTGIKRFFTISGDYFTIVENYIKLRPKTCTTNRFFINFTNGRCTNQAIGKNKLGKMPEKIAKYFKLPNAKEYTGHSFRRTSTTILANTGADICTIKRHGAWKSATVAEGYIAESVSYKKQTENLIANSINRAETASAPPATITTCNLQEDLSNNTTNSNVCEWDDNLYFDEIELDQINDIEEKAVEDSNIGQESNVVKNSSKMVLSQNISASKYDMSDLRNISFINCSNIQLYFKKDD